MNPSKYALDKILKLQEYHNAKLLILLTLFWMQFLLGLPQQAC
jgi:hypothetical protein